MTTQVTRTGPLTFKEQARLAYEKQADKHLWLDRLLDRPLFIIVFVALNIGLAFLMREVEAARPLGTIQGVLALVVGIIFASSRRYPLSYLLYIVAYIAGSEVMWRQNEFPLFWESGKYFMMVLLVGGWIRERTGLSASRLAVLYAALLAPGLLFTVSQTADIKALLSPHATGPVSLFVALLFFHGKRFTMAELRRTFIMFAVPALAVTAIVSYRVSTFDVAWTGDSNNSVAGFGANQVSTAIGLGWTLLLIAAAVLSDQFARRKRILFIGMMLAATGWMVIANFFTFSRGGLIGSMLATAVCGAFLLLVQQKRILIIIAAIISVVVILAIFPVLDRTTQGNLARRYNLENEEFGQLSGRDAIIRQEFDLFLEYPVLGVGIGRAPEERRERFASNVTSHTEYTRLLAEHGLFGLGINVLFGVLALSAIRTQPNHVGRAITAALLAWGFFYMFHSATRTVAPAFVIGLATAQLAYDYAAPKVVAAARVVPRIVRTPQPTPALGTD